MAGCLVDVLADLSFLYHRQHLDRGSWEEALRAEAAMELNSLLATQTTMSQKRSGICMGTMTTGSANLDL